MTAVEEGKILARYGRWPATARPTATMTDLRHTGDTFAASSGAGLKDLMAGRVPGRREGNRRPGPVSAIDSNTVPRALPGTGNGRDGYRTLNWPKMTLAGGKVLPGPGQGSITRSPDGIPHRLRGPSALAGGLPGCDGH